MLNEDKNGWVDKNKLYALSHEKGGDAIELVMYVDPEFDDFGGICYLTPGSNGHMIDGNMGEKTDQGFTFFPVAMGKNKEWEFIEVTYENFKNKYSKIVEGGKEILTMVSNTAELEDWYHDKFPFHERR